MSTKKKKTFRMKNPPVKPVRRSRRESFELYEGISLAALLDWAGQWSEVNLSDVNLHQEYSDYCENWFELVRNETDEEFNSRMQEYNKDLVEYQKWEKENLEAIKNFKAEQVAKEKARKEKQKEKEKIELEKKLKNYEKEIVTLRKKLKKDS